MRYYDIWRVTTELRRRNKEKQLRSLIERYAGAYSISNDLDVAQRTMRTFFETVSPATPGIEKRADLGHEEIGAALFTHALTYYVRATHHNSKPGKRGRVGIDFERRYSVEEKIAHSKIVKVRNDDIAHVSVDAIDQKDNWNRWSVVIALDDNNRANIYFPYAFINWRQTLVNTLSNLIDAARLLVADDIRTRGKEALDYLAAHHHEPEIAQLFFSSIFDPVDFFGSVQSADQFFRTTLGEKNDAGAWRDGRMIQREISPDSSN